MKFFDLRLRPPMAGFLNMILYTLDQRRNDRTRMHGFEPAPSAMALSMDMLLEEMEQGGVAMGMVVGRHSGQLGSITNDDVKAVVDAYPDRFVGAASIDPLERNEALENIDRCMANGFKAVNLEPASYDVAMMVDDSRLYPIYAHCENQGIVIMIMAGGTIGSDLSYTYPVHLDRMAGDFPKLKIIVTHGGWPWVHQVLHIAYRRPNLYVSPDQYLANMPGMRDYISAADGFLADRFLYGSSYPFTPVKDYAKWYRGLPLKPENMVKTGYANAVALFGLDTNRFK